jgi:hypothetical protein
MENCTCASFYTVRGVHKKDCPAFTPPSTTRSDAEVQRIKSLYRGVVNLDVEPNRYEFPNYEAADKAIDELIRRIAAQERQAGKDEALQHLKHCHLRGRKSYSTDSWDAGYHDALFDAERAILTARSPKDGETRV